MKEGKMAEWIRFVATRSVSSIDLIDLLLEFGTSCP